MSMYDNIDFIFFHNPKVCFGINRFWCSKHDIRKLCSCHRATPAIGHTGTKRLTNQCFWFTGVTHVCHVHCGRYFTVNCSWFNFCLFPKFLCMLRCTTQPSLNTISFSILCQSKVCHFMSKVIDIFPFCLYAPLFCNTKQFFRVFYLIISVRCNMSKGMTDFTSMIRMSCSSACNKTKKVSSCNSMCITATDSSWCFWCDSAWSHRTDPTAYSLLTKFTMRSLIFYSRLPRICSYLFSCF